MRFPKKALFFLGWLSFYLSTQLFAILLTQYIFSYLEKNYPYLSIVFPLLILLIICFFIGFISFVVSIRVVIIPPYRNSKIMPIEILKANPTRYFMKWLEYVAEYLLWCSPLIIRVGFPYEYIARFIWQLVVGYGVYNSVVRSWFEENNTYKQQNQENHPATTELS